jgi:hypothetical protein
VGQANARLAAAGRSELELLPGETAGEAIARLASTAAPAPPTDPATDLSKAFGLYPRGALASGVLPVTPAVKVPTEGVTTILPARRPQFDWVISKGE